MHNKFNFKRAALLCCLIWSCQSNEKIIFLHDINFPEIGKIISSADLKKEVTDTANNNIYRYILENDKGKMQVKIFYLSNDKIKMEGQYEEAPNLSVDTAYKENPENPADYIKQLIQYYQPIKEGKWVFYDENGNIIKEEQYVKGVKKKYL
jgi:hypothetical protein